MTMENTDNRYLLLYVTAEDGEPWSAESDDIADWLETVEPTGISIVGERLTGIEDARMITKRSGSVTVTDGPFAEFKEWFAGFDLINAPDLETAVEIGSRHPSARFGKVLVLSLMHDAQSEALLEETKKARGIAD